MLKGCVATASNTALCFPIIMHHETGDHHGCIAADSAKVGVHFESLSQDFSTDDPQKTQASNVGSAKSTNPRNLLQDKLPGPPLHAPMCSLDHVCTGPAAHNCPKQGLSLRPTWASEFRIRCFYPKMMPQMRLQPELADGFFERLLSTFASREASRMKTSGRNSNPHYPQVINIYSVYIYILYI